jgi:enoyl-CoA hydratase/carnithine racemase
MSDIASEVRDGICIIRVGKAPDGLMTGEMCVAAEGLVEAAANDPTVRVIIFTGALPGVFIKHFSVVEIEDRTRALQQRGWTIDKGLPFDDRPQDRMMSKIESMSKPVIAAINGTCMGFGYELALCCDIRVAQQGAHSIGLPEANIGIFPGAGGTQRLPRLVGPARALEMLLLGSTFTPDEAKTEGLVGSVVVDALDTAIAFARKIMSRPLAQSGHLKRLVRSACDMPIDEGRKLERLLSADIATSEEGLAVLARFNRRNGDIRDNHCE